METHRLHLLLILLISSAITSPEAISSGSPPATQLFVLGDSTASLFSNCIGSPHRLLPDTIADRMGLRPLPSYNMVRMWENLTDEALAGGINFGDHEAKILSDKIAVPPVDRLIPLRSSLSKQLMQAKWVLQRLKLEAGDDVGLNVASSSVFVISFGTKDYVDLYSTGPENEVALKYGKKGLSRVLVHHMELAVQTLYNANVRKIACIGVAPLGCDPEIISRSSTTLQGRGCNDEVNDVISDYNAKLAERLLELQRKLAGLHIVFCDTYKGIMEIISNHHTYGFKSVDASCCQPDSAQGVRTCNDPSTYVWREFDATTAAVNTLLANWSWLPSEARHQICSPVALHQMA